MPRMLAQLPSTAEGFFVNIRRQNFLPCLDSTVGKGRSHGDSRPSPLTCYNQRFPMADIRPFSALRYNLRQVSASQVVTQPYDKISPAMQERYYAASPYNLVRIILGRSEAGDNRMKNVYTRAADFSRDWRRNEVLQQEAAPSIYSYSQAFT